LKLLSLPP